MSPIRSLKITNARENNLKGIDLELPHDQFIAVSGLSGSGKSSLAFDTVYAEGQRRYIETFSPYTRQFFDKVKKPTVDAIENVRPAVAIQQRTRVLNSRSTVGTMTDLNDYLKVVWSNLSKPICAECGIDLIAWDKAKIADLLLRWSSDRPESKFLICADVVLSKSSKAALATIDSIRAQGYSRYLKGAEIRELDESPFELKKGLENRITYVVARTRAGAFNRQSVEESLEQGFSLGSGSVKIVELLNPDTRPKPISGEAREYRFSREAICESSGKKIERARPSLFSFNHPIGACPECKGFGKILVVDEKKIIPDRTKSLEEGAIECWNGPKATWERKQLKSFCKDQEIPFSLPWSELSAEQRKLIFEHKTKGSSGYYGINAWFNWLETKKYKMHVRVFLARYRTPKDCPSCNGTRLKSDALAYRIKGLTIPQIWQMPVSELSTWIAELRASLTELPRQLKDVFANIESRLKFLNDLGLGYLTLERQARTLSGGETQRVNLVTALGSNLISTHFVLDEPSVGLHARDTLRLITALKALHSRGNSLLVVEHDPECILAADTVLELGPKAGSAGGQVTYLGPSNTWPGLGIKLFSAQKTAPPKDPCLSITQASARNLNNLSVQIPLDAFVCFTGVSGSGKSTLAHEIIKAGFEEHKGHQERPAGIRYKIEGFEHLEEVLFIDQSALAKSPRANIATYTKIWDRVRDMFAETEEAQLRALSKSAFSFNVNAGRCTACEGAGFIREDMQFLSDVFVPCEECLGKRFKPVVLEVTLKGKNVDDLLKMTVSSCSELFPRERQIQQSCEILCRLGLGHLTLGHPLSELSGGEAQRLKLVPFIQGTSSKKSMLIFDEPTTGLHIQDVENLLSVFHLLRQQGHSVICIEHNLRLIAEADWIIDLGPEGGAEGGSVVAVGTPADLINSKDRSYTANFLAEFVDQYGRGSPAKKAKVAKSRISKGSVKAIEIRGAREHNLKNVSLSVPLNKFLTFTGVSGSGKSTIAKDIIYAEGQRRYLDCLSPYARQFIKELRKPEIDDITNLQPTICVYQHTFQPTALSTVGTMSEAYNFLRLLFAKLGLQHCPEHPKQAIAALGAEAIAESIKGSFSGQVRILAPVVKLKKGTHRTVFERAIASEIGEVRVDGVFMPPSRGLEGLAKSKAHTIEYVVAKCKLSSLSLELLTEGVSQALLLGGGTLVVVSGDGDTVFSSERTCPQCQRGFFKPDPEDLSFHSKRGRCAACAGYGLDSKGSLCAKCQGSRLNEIGRNIRLEGQTIFELSMLRPSALLDHLLQLTWRERSLAIASPVVRELKAKLSTLCELGLDHIPLSRDCTTLSGGELQRLRLATAMGSPLTGVLYIFDEPSAGLHPVDNAKVLEKLKELRDRGNSIIQIEHEADSILASDYIIEVGPGAGREGGEIVFSGEIEKFLASKKSITARLMNEEPNCAVPSPQAIGSIRIESGQSNNIRDLSIKFPLHQLVSVVGVSGAGKSSFVHGIVSELLINGKKTGLTWKNSAGVLTSTEEIERVLVVDQQPIGINSRSTPISYLGVWDEIRNLFSKIPEAEARGWGKSFFSYNSGKGRCQVCKGLGEIKLEMSFLAEAKIPCEECAGERFSLEAQSIKYLNMSVNQVLRLTFEEARSLFINHKKIHRVLKTACDLGLGYLVLGQASPTLSGGESQRLKLTGELNTERRGHTVYILDEPTTGLHKLDVAKLVSALHMLIAKGHSVLVIEHDRDLIMQSHHLIEFGPGPGEDGGRITFTGTPSELRSANTAWGRELSKSLQKNGVALHE